jgi:hypothetical protein
MEALARLVTDSMARHGFDRPVDPRRLQWSRWFRCDSPHSLLVVPSKPGIFAISEEIADFAPSDPNVETTATESLPRAQSRGPAERSSAAVSGLSNSEARPSWEGHDFSSEPNLSQRTTPLGGAALQPCDSSSGAQTLATRTDREGHDFSRAAMPARSTPALAAEGTAKRILAVLQFSEDDDMAFTLDRMFTRINPMRARLASGRCFIRFVVIQDQDQRRSICSALNQWMISSAEKASGLPATFSSSLEINTAEESLGTPRVGRTLLSANANTVPVSAPATEPNRTTDAIHSLPHLDSGANQNLHCPHPLPSGF